MSADPGKLADEVIRFFEDRKGFDWWWDDLDEGTGDPDESGTQAEIRRSLTERIATTLGRPPTNEEADRALVERVVGDHLRAAWQAGRSQPAPGDVFPHADTTQAAWHLQRAQTLQAMPVVDAAFAIREDMANGLRGERPGLRKLLEDLLIAKHGDTLAVHRLMDQIIREYDR